MKKRKKEGKNNEERGVTYNPSFLREFNSKRIYLFWHYVDRIAYKIGKIGKIYENLIGNTYREEREQFDLYDSKNILHIGCGSYPITAMILSEMDDVKIVTIDNNSKSIERAKKIIKERSLENKIQAKYGNGTNFPFDGFDTIIVSGCSLPKIEVFNHVINNSKPKTRIIIRDSYLDGESIVRITNSHDKIDIVKKMENCPMPTSKWTSFYMVKK